MKKIMMVALAASSLATPAIAKDGAAYIGIEGGVLFPKDQDGDVFVNYTTTQTVPTTPTVVGPADTTYNNGFGVDYKKGIDLDLIAGYDFGMFRLEAELGWKRAGLDEFTVDSSMITALNTALNRPDNDVGAVGGFAPLTADDVDLSGKVKVLSGMINALLDINDTFYVGGGFGRAKVKALGDSDGAWA